MQNDLRRWMRLVEAQTTPFYHGSENPLVYDLLLKPQGTYVQSDDPLEQMMERHRPADKIPRHAAVYLVDDPDNVDDVGGYTDHIYRVEPTGKIERSDLAWYSFLQTKMADDADPDLLRKICLAYWNGKQCPRGSVWEYRVEAAIVKKEV